MATKKSAALQKWDEKFAGYAKAATETISKVGSSFATIKFGRGDIIVNGSTIKDGKAELVVLGNCALNAWYEGKYDPDDRQPPDCYALADKYGDEDMAPHPDAANPQAKTCALCDKNTFGSADNGKGKACSNKIRIAALLASDLEDAESAQSAELAVATISPTNAKYWAKHVKEVAEDHGRPPWAVVSEVQTFNDPKTQIRVEWKFVEEVTDGDILNVLEERAAKAQEALQQPFQAPAAAAPASGKKVVGGSKKFAAGKGGRR